MADSADPDQPAVGWRTDAAIASRRQDAALYASDAPCTGRSSFRSFCSGPSTPRRHPRPPASVFGPPKTLPSPVLPARPRRAMPPCSIFATASRRAWCRPKVRIPVDRRFASPNRPRQAAENKAMELTVQLSHRSPSSDDRFDTLRRLVAKELHPDFFCTGGAVEKTLRAEFFKKLWPEIEQLAQR